MDTANFSSSSQNLPWLWSIEALTDCEEVDTALLDELSNNVPEFHDQSWGRNARERLALRHTEDLLRGLTTNAEAIDVASTSIPHSKFDISVSEGAEDVLLRVRDQITAANLRMSELELLKSAVRQYIIQKRASLPECTLQQLKDKSVEGNEMSAIFLWQSSEVGREHQETTVAKGGGPVGAAEIIDQSTNTVAVQPFDANSTFLAPENGNELSRECHGKIHFAAVSDASRSPGHRVEDGKDHSVIEVSSSSDQANEVMEEDPQDATSLPSKRKRSICKEQNEACLDVSNVSAASSKDHVDAEMNGRPVQCPPQRDLLSSISEVNESAQGAEVQDPQENGASAADDDTRVYNSRVADNEGKILEGAPSDGPHQNNHASNSTKPEASGCKDGNLDKPHSCVSDVDIANAAEKVSFLSSQNISERSDCPGQSLCVKCNKGGQLLICCVSSCRIAVHESCVGSSGYFDNTGNFHCPFCSFADATNAYRETKKKATLVREKAAVARDHLLKFMCMIRAQQQEQLSQMLPMEDLRQSKVIEDVNVINESRDIRQQQQKIIGKQSDLGTEHRQEVEVDGERINNSALDKRASVSPLFCEKTNVSPTRGETIAVENHQDARMLEDQEPLDISSNPRDDLPQGEEDTNIIFKKIPVVSLSNEMGKTKLDERQQSPIREKESKQGEPAGTTASLDIENTDLEQNVRPAQGPSSHPNVDPEDISASENEDCMSYEFRRRRLPFDHYSKQASPNSRRKKIPWTTEEEEKLKEGVKKFGETNGKSIPWKKILLFGEHIFQESRTTVDLKDKWRNIWSKEGRAALS